MRPFSRIATRGLTTALALGALGLLWSGAPQVAQAATFQQVCGLSTTINCWGFESENELYYHWYTNENCNRDSFLLNHPNGNNPFGLDRRSPGNTTARIWNIGDRCHYPKRDTTYAASGASSLKFTLPSQSAAVTSGDFNPVFKYRVVNGQYRFARFGPGGEFWVRFAMRQTQDLLNPIYRRSGGGGISGIKRMIVHGYESSESLEEAMQDIWQRGVPQLYSDSGTEDYGVQDVIGCPRQNPDVASSYTEPPCRKWKANQWVVFQIHVKVATNAPRYDNGVVELYIDDEPNPIVRVTNSSMSGLTAGPAYTEDAIWDDVTNGYGKLTFTLYTTDKDINQVHPEAYMWIDDVVVSHTRVPKIDGNVSETNPPAPPTNLRAQ
jgi:hypothetical protein